MPTIEALGGDAVVVITGAADGIGLAAASYFHSRGMRVCLADLDGDKLAQAAAGLDGALAVATDVSRLDDVQSLKEQVYAEWGRVDLLMNNAGAAFGTSCWDDYENWRKTLDVNLYGVVHGLQCFVPAMLAQNTPGLVINTGSKQGITNPPGNPAYNVSKAAIKALTEQLQHSFRSSENCQLSAHLLVPGFTYTGMIRRWITEKPDGAWLPEQVVEFMVDALDREQFYILCPDGDVSPEIDKLRMRWAMDDLVEGRPALSRWHADFEQAFDIFVSSAG